MASGGVVSECLAPGSWLLDDGQSLGVVFVVSATISTCPGRSLPRR